MNPRQFLRAMKHLLGEFIPWQLVDVLRGRDYDAAIGGSAALHDLLATELPDGVEPHSPVAPPSGPTPPK